MRFGSPMIDDHLDCGNCSTSSQIILMGRRMLILRAEMCHVMMMCSHFDGSHRAMMKSFELEET